VYARVATGFQPSFIPGSPQPMVGERAVDYDVGLKAAFLESKALVDLSVFYVDQKDIPVTIFPNNVYTVTNGARATSRGFELTTSYVPIPDLELAYIADLTRAALVSVVPYADNLLTGYQIPYVPKWTMSARAAYIWPLGGLWHARIGGDIRWIGQMFGSGGGDGDYVQAICCQDYPEVVVPSYHVIDANAQVSRGSLRLKLYVRNLTDERGLIGRNSVLSLVSNSNAGGFQPFEIQDKLLQPRTMGFGVDYTF